MLLFVFALSLICIFISYCYTRKSRVCDDAADEGKNQYQNILTNINRGSRISSSTNYHSDSNGRNDQPLKESQTDGDFKILDCAVKNQKDNCVHCHDYHQSLCQHLKERRDCSRYCCRCRKKTKADGRYLDEYAKITTGSYTLLKNEGKDDFDNIPRSQLHEMRNLDCSSDEDGTDDATSSIEDYFGDDEDSDEYCEEEHLHNDINREQDYYCDGPDFCAYYNDNRSKSKNSTLSSLEEKKSCRVLCKKQESPSVAQGVLSDSKTNKSNSQKR